MARIENYDQGDVWVPTSTFSIGGVPTDVTNITVKTMAPDGTVATLGPVSGATGGGGITRVSAGTYSIQVPLTDAGHWFAKFIATGTGAAATHDHQANVDPSVFYESGQLATHALVSLAETRDWLQQQNQEPPDALELARLINDVSDRFIQEAEREFKPRVPNPSARTFEVTFRPWDPWYIDGDFQGNRGTGNIIKVGDLTSFTAVDIIDEDWTTVLTPTVPLTSVESLPRNRASWEPIRELRLHSSVTDLSPGRTVRVTGTWGFPSVPGSVRQAVLDGIAAIRDRDVEHYRQDIGVGTSIEGGGGTTIMLQGGGQRLLSLPPSTLAEAWRWRDNHVG